VRFGIRWQLALLTLVTALSAASLIAWMGYRAETAATMAGVDRQLRAIVVAVPEILPGDYHDRVDEGRVGPAEYEALVDRLTGLADGAGVYYLYTCIQREGKIVFASTSASEQEKSSRTWSGLLDEYREPPPELIATFGDGRARFASYKDEFGSFRSMFYAVDERTPRGPRRVVAGADVRLNDLRAIAMADLRWYAWTALLVAAVVGGAGLLAGRAISKPIRKLTAEIREFADEDFTGDKGSVAEVRRLSLGVRTETAELARTFLEMRKRLRERIRELTRVTGAKERIEGQLAVARQIQRGLLPAEPPEAPGFDIAGWSEAADQTGGDFYDWITTPGGQVIVNIADVTGHGIGPAIMASVCRAYARATLTEERPLAAMVAQLNSLLTADTQGGDFVTFFAGILDPRRRRMLVVSAGHGPVMFYRARSGDTESLATHAAPLGIQDDFVPDPGTEIVFEPGDVMLLVSDGFFEWMNREGRQFGVRRLAESLRRAAVLPAARIIESIRADVTAFTAGTEQPDDMTAVVIKCEGDAGEKRIAGKTGPRTTPPR
jgi:serine phosphatase RsbU (regulator of sigma subunit)